MVAPPPVGAESESEFPANLEQILSRALRGEDVSEDLRRLPDPQRRQIEPFIEGYRLFTKIGSVEPGKSADSGRSSADSRVVIGHYRIIKEIGRGGQGIVYLAEDTHLDRYVALKVLDSGPATDRTAFERFRREAEITSKIDNPGICSVYETGEDGDTLWIAMRYVEGESLAKRISRAKEPGGNAAASVVEIPEQASPELATRATAEADPASGPTTWIEIARVLALFEQTARALHVAHEHGVIHRDLKPGNIMVTTDGAPVILDFGLAQEVTGDRPPLTLTGELMGTPAYMSPEQIAAQRIRLDRRTDVYSLGVSLFECLTLKRPFDAPTTEGTYQAILTKNPPDPRDQNRSIPHDLKVVLETALEKDRDRRYLTALDFAEELRRVRSFEPIHAKPIGPFLRLRRWAQRNPALATSLGSFIAVLAVGLFIALMLLGRVTDETNAKERALGAVTLERNEKQAVLSDYERLGDLSRFQRLISGAEALWPAEPKLIPAMKTWVDQALDLEKRLPGHREILERLRRSALPDSDEDRAPYLADYQSDTSVAEPSRPSEGRRAWRFASSADQFRHDTTARLVDSLTSFVDSDPRRGLMADVRGRLRFAELVERETIRKYESRWNEAIQSIADRNRCPKLEGLKIRPQLGLIPIGMDAASGLWEFIHLQTAAEGVEPTPLRDKDGKLVVTESMGLVFVLIPGGRLSMGAVRPDGETPRSDPNIDPEAAENESPVTQISIDPFFISKYEMTQGQWLRLVGRNPSQYLPGSRPGVDLRNPVEQVSWEECSLWLTRAGLILPSEAQWEYAARAGTTAPRWTGIATDGLGRAANLADEFCRSNGGPRNWHYEAWNDGFAFHAPVGSFDPNPFGLHDVLGNVLEWCRDWYGAYDVSAAVGDGLRCPSDRREHVGRGGSWLGGAANARSACRGSLTTEGRSPTLGVRPARRLF